MIEYIKKVDSGYIFFCQGCREYHYLDKSYGFRGTTDKPSFMRCAIITNKDMPEEFNGKSDEIPRMFVECNFRIRGGCIHYWDSTKHGLRGIRRMVPLNDITVQHPQIRYEDSQTQQEFIDWDKGNELCSRMF